MDQAKLSYFMEKFESYEPDELGDLVARRTDLAEEAIEALDLVLQKKGLSASVLVAHPQRSARTEEGESKYIAQETRSSRELWRGGLAMACKLMVAMTFMAPVQNLLKSLTIGAIWAGLFVVAAGYAGYQLGQSITKNICSDGDVSISAKRKKLWLMFGLLWPIFFFVYVVSHALFVRS